VLSKKNFLERNVSTERASFTHGKISHLVASLPTSRQQVVFAMLVPSCQQVCNNLVDIIRFVARLFQQVRYSHDITILLQPRVVNLVTFLLYHDCIRLVGTTLSQVWWCHQACYKLLTARSKLVTTIGNKQCEHNSSTACEQIWNNLFADFVTTCAFLRV
jgi:hypothetical protein